MIGGREASVAIIPGRCALSVNDPGTPLPSGWAWVRLSDVAELGTGHTPSRKHPEYWNGTIPWIGIRDAGAHHGRVIFDTVQHVTQAGLDNSSARLLPKQTVCLSRTASVGYVVIMGRPMATSQDFVTWSCSDALEPEFLLKAILAEGEHIREFGEGSTHTTIYFPEVKAFHLSLPPLPEQRRIVAKIDSLSAKSARARDHLDHIPRLVEKYKQAVLAAAFRGDLTREWRNSQIGYDDASAYVGVRSNIQKTRQGSRDLGRDERTAQIALDDDLRAELARINKAEPLPSSWCWSMVGLVFGVYIGATPSRKDENFWNGGISWVSSGEVAFCRISKTAETITEIGLKSTSTRLHPKGTILVGMIGEGRTRGQAAILDVEASNNQNSAAIRVSEASYSPDYVYWYLWMTYAQTRRAGSGNNQQALNKERVQRLPVPVAPPVEAEEIAKRVEKLFAWIDHLAAEATSARKLVDRLDQAVLAKAFRGELVPQDPNDEPATVLLERIRQEQAATARPAGRRGRSRKTA